MRPMKQLAAIVLSAAAALAFAVRADASPTVLVDGQKVVSDAPPIEVAGRVLVPLRGIFEQLGAAVNYDAATQDVTVELGNRVIDLTIGSKLATVNGAVHTLDVAPRTFAGRTEVPLRFIGEALGASVDYDSASDTVAVVTGRRQGNFVAAISGPPSAASSYGQGQSQGIPPTVEDQRPEPNTLVGSAYPEIYARFAGGSSAVDPGSVQVTLDGNDVTQSATISSAYVSFTPPYRLETGQHTVEVAGRADDGTAFDEQWTFRVDAGTGPSEISSILDNGYGAFGYPGYGFYPPGFSLFVPGPMYFVGGTLIEIVFYSPFFPYGNGFFTVGGLPGQYSFQPWYGYPGYYWATVPVPMGVRVPISTVTAHYITIGGHHVVVQSTAPIHIDGTRTTFPSTLRFANLPHLIGRPTSPLHLVVFQRMKSPSTGGVTPAASSGSTLTHIEPVYGPSQPGGLNRIYVPPTPHPVPIATMTPAPASHQTHGAGPHATPHPQPPPPSGGGGSAPPSPIP